MGKNVTLYLNTLQNEACLSADFWLSLSEKGFPVIPPAVWAAGRYCIS